MPTAPSPNRALPTRGQALLFQCKAVLHRARRTLADRHQPIPRQSPGQDLAQAPIVAEHSALLWNHPSDAELALTAGKIQNLRVACAALHGLEFPPDSIFSFWKQLGRATTRKGYTTGRELREGCLIANIGGGLCQLTNLLYSAALDARLEIVERHAHSRTIPGSLAESDRDATVFWNYVDLRFRSSSSFRLETILSATHLTVRIRAQRTNQQIQSHSPPADKLGAPTRSNPSGDCLSCGMSSCFRHPSSNTPPSTLGHTAFLLDAYWPEFQAWCTQHSRNTDRWLLPIDGHRWKKANYAWSTSNPNHTHYATVQTLCSAFESRRLPLQGAVRQRSLLKREEALAKDYTLSLDPQARHLVLSQNLLPHLWMSGALGGRSFDVLMTRWPISELQRRLDEAAQHHSSSQTLTDFRADPNLVRAEEEALAAAARLITPHRAIANYFGSRALLLDWVFPPPEPLPPNRSGRDLFFPASPLGRKGIYELAAALDGLDAELLVLGRATEEGAHGDSSHPLATIPHRPATPSDLLRAKALVLPAWIEHQPRLALRALANGIPVIASAACGLPDHPLLCQLAEPNPERLHAALVQLLTPDAKEPVQRAS